MRKRIWNPSTCIWENGKCVAIIMDDPAIICDEVIESYANLSRKDDGEKLILTKKDQPVKHKFFIFYLHFY